MMKSPRRKTTTSHGFQMLSKQAQRQLMQYEYVIISLMLLVTFSSIIWSITIHILSGDLHNGIIGAKLAFRQRDLSLLSERAKSIFYHDLETIFNETYTTSSLTENDGAKGLSTTALRIAALDESGQITEQPKPQRQIAHVFQTNSKWHEPEVQNLQGEDGSEDNGTETVPKVKFNAELDRKFLSTTVVDVQHTRWRSNAAVHFIYSFPFLSEIIAIIWTAMCLIFQSGVKKYWGLPKPWRIVIPSLAMFSLMSLGTFIYMIVANSYLKDFCQGLRAPLTNPAAISCGQALSVLRPIVRHHDFSHDAYLDLFRISYVLALVFWVLALSVMLLRYVFAIDFQFVDVYPSFDATQGDERTRHTDTKAEFTEVLLSPSQYQCNFLEVDKTHKSDDDFQSARSHFSELAVPLLESPTMQLATQHTA